MEHQQILINLANLNAHRAKEEEMHQEIMRYDKVLEEAAAQRAKELNKGKVREEENETDDEETEDEGDECSVSTAITDDQGARSVPTAEPS
ncbi:hypothetical protein PIB30_094662, partial [Stylosanthes scabra]|nr:hypothetical protein [Stylosanthes scabra]